jgi:hypothetical protein
MPLTDPYLTVAQFKTRSRSTVSTNDSAIEAVLLAASRQVDNWCGRQFGQGSAGESRVYVSRYGDLLNVDDMVAVTAVATDPAGDGTYTTVWAATDYRLEPINAAGIGQPFIRIRAGAVSPLWWPAAPTLVRITGTFGWPSVPAPVREATYLLANRLKAMWDTPAGLSGGGEMGSLDMTGSITPIVAAMLAPYRVMTV